MKGRRTEPSGVLVVDKPEGPTSHDVVDVVRKGARLAKVGHTGTLDPFATGVLPLCLNRATRIAALLTDGDKEYEATLRLGVTTRTQDRTGEVEQTRPVPPGLSLEMLQQVAGSFVGVTTQRPPMFSAVKVGGQRLYELARQGVEVERERRVVHIHAFEILSLEGDLATFRVACGKGTYVRTLAADLGEELGCGAHLTALRRTRSAGIGLARAHTMVEVAEAMARDALESLILPMEEALGGLPKVELGEGALRTVGNGQPVRVRDVVAIPRPLVLGQPTLILVKGRLVAIGSAQVDGDGAGLPAGGVVVTPTAVLISAEG